MCQTAGALERFAFLFSQDGGYLRIPIWGHIPLSRPARRIIGHPDFVRLQRIRQLGFVSYVFPGASHTRFEHSIGAYHLSCLMLRNLVLCGSADRAGIAPEEARLFLASALLHDVGHYPFAHLVDMLPAVDQSGGVCRAFRSHEDRAVEYIAGDRSHGSIYGILKDDWKIADPEQVARIISDPASTGLPGRMLSGILDPDKMDYLMRDASACGVPYGSIDADRLIESLVLDDDGERRRLGITEKGIAPLESLVFAKYMMFRHIYWHHAARIASAMLTRYVQDAVDAGVVNPEEFYRLSDDVLIESLPSDPRSVSSADLMARLRTRELYKRGFTLFPEHPAGEEEFTLSGHEMERVKDLYRRPELRREKEIAVCRLLNDLQGFELSGFEVLLDIPRLSSVFDLADFRDLRVLVSPRAGSGGRFVPFNSFGFTLLTADFAQEFERYSRRLQVICRPDLREAVRTLWREITALVVE
ncbi:MAG: HD domain-containing protein [Armatimonadetes bacterium]|nr:HD domain-containing protein [Armatimonadota bacterium]